MESVYNLLINEHEAVNERWKQEKIQGATKLIVENRKAYHDYHILERIEAGIELSCTEVKSLRQGKVNSATVMPRSSMAKCGSMECISAL